MRGVLPLPRTWRPCPWFPVRKVLKSSADEIKRLWTYERRYVTSVKNELYIHFAKIRRVRSLSLFRMNTSSFVLEIFEILQFTQTCYNQISTSFADQKALSAWLFQSHENCHLGSTMRLPHGMTCSTEILRQIYQNILASPKNFGKCHLTPFIFSQLKSTYCVLCLGTIGENKILVRFKPLLI